MKRHLAVAVFLLVCVLSVAQAQAGPAPAPAPSAAPVNPNATPQARALLRYLDSISGHGTLTGQHNFPNSVSRWSDRIYDLTGKYPALFGQDFGFSGMDDKDSTEGRPSMIQEVKRQYENGAVIALTWHAVRPTEDEPVTFRDSVQGHLTDFEWSELLTPGSNLYNRWCAQVDVIAGYLRELSDASAPVLLRPYHEMNGNWFWWGGRPGNNGSAALYRQLFDRLVNYHKLNNLVWVWNVNSPSENAGAFADYYPGPRYVDVLTVDIYGEFKQEYYTDILALAGDKPVALGEVGAMPSLDVLAQQPRWAYFMVWSGLAEGSNQSDKLQAIYHAPNLLTRDDPTFARAMAAMRSDSAGQNRVIEPVSPRASTAATALLARLYEVSGKTTLSGQQNDARFVAGASGFVVQATAKQPAIYGADLGIPKEAGITEAAARQAIIDEARRQYQQHAIVNLGWLAIRPTDDSPASFDQSVHGQLTDFEWRELLTPGTRLNQRWCAQVDSVAASLAQLQDAGIPVLWSPYVESNSKKYWWAGRKGIQGSAELYRMLFERLVVHDGLRNLIWVWDAGPPGFGPAANGSYTDFFPGLLYADALALTANQVSTRFRADSSLKLLGGGKVVGLFLAGVVPDPSLFAQQTDWAWFLLSPESANTGNATGSTTGTVTIDRSQQLQKLYGDPRVISRAP
jgi:mannan endo-1,4-beta-mannosidase